MTEEDIDDNGLGRLLSKGLGRRRRKREEEQRASEARGRCVASRGTLENHSPFDNDDSISPGHGDADTNSVVTYDSDTES